MADDWKKIELGGTWNYKEEEPGAEFTGTLIKMEEGIGENNSKVYTFKTPDGEITSVWGSTVLDVRLGLIEPGEEVKIVYLGQVASDKRKGKSYHNFDVYHRPQAMKKVGASGSVNPEDVPF